MEIIETAKEEGRDEKVLEIAKNLILENLPMQIIERTTGLSLETIQKIAKELDV